MIIIDLHHNATCFWYAIVRFILQLYHEAQISDHEFPFFDMVNTYLHIKFLDNYG